MKFRYQVLAVVGATGIGSWRADFVRLPAQSKVRIEGVLTAQFAQGARCRIFREWWHSAETP